jgi:hypothetical protein
MALYNRFISHSHAKDKSIAAALQSVIQRLGKLQFGVLIAVGFISIQALVLIAIGQPLICTCGIVKWWTGNVLSSENSQQLTDWYTFTHLVHGFGLYLFLALLAPRLPLGLRLALSVGIEAGWEILENTPFFINHYRQLALAQGYLGDSVINSIGDTLATVVGFMLASVLPTWSTITLAVTIELFLGFMIYDNLTLNIIQLVHPFGVITRWQAGG